MNEREDAVPIFLVGSLDLSRDSNVKFSTRSDAGGRCFEELVIRIWVGEMIASHFVFKYSSAIYVFANQILVQLMILSIRLYV